jgi:ribosomal protein RSM22 (predicted rRNA methylase)
VADLPEELAAALARETGRADLDRLGARTARLIDRYQADVPAAPGRPIMAADLDALAYAAYRMPATYAAIRAALEQVADEIGPGTSHLDVAGGTGAAVWAVADRWPRMERHIVLEQSAAAGGLGRRLTGTSARQPVRDTDWQSYVIDGDPQLPTADLITIGYLLGELPEDLRRRLISAAAAAADRLLIIVEPGTKAGYRRIIAARDQLIAGGWSMIAPCPHDARCPLQEQDADWCHFAARLNRSTLHRQVKGADRGYEDEKFSYLIASPAPAPRVPGRVLRHPWYGKGRVDLMVCQGSGSAGRVVIAKRRPEQYRAARRTEWGDGWPPDGIS